jgi:hypothetical protein
LSDALVVVHVRRVTTLIGYCNDYNGPGYTLGFAIQISVHLQEQTPIGTCASAVAISTYGA